MKCTWAIAADVPAIRRHCRFAGAIRTDAGGYPQTNRRRNRLAPNAPCSTWANDVMDSDKDDLAVLCHDMTKEEVDRIHRFYMNGASDRKTVSRSIRIVDTRTIAGGSQYNRRAIARAGNGWNSIWLNTDGKNRRAHR